MDSGELLHRSGPQRPVSLFAFLKVEENRKVRWKGCDGMCREQFAGRGTHSMCVSLSACSFLTITGMPIAFNY